MRRKEEKNNKSEKKNKDETGGEGGDKIKSEFSVVQKNGRENRRGGGNRAGQGRGKMGTKREREWEGENFS